MSTRSIRWLRNEVVAGRKPVPPADPVLQYDYPGSSQVVLLRLDAASDSVVWYTAKDHGFVIVTRDADADADADFEELSLVWGQPPKVIWFKTRNQPRATTLKILLDNRTIGQSDNRTIGQSDNRTMIEDALLNRGQACVEMSDSS